MYRLQKRFAAVFFLSIMILFTGCGDSGYKHITHEDAQLIIQSNPDAIILDVRTPEEFSKKHIPNAVLVPIEDVRGGKLSKLPDKNATILIYCWTGRRAEDAAELLIKRGYTNVYEFGGLVDWTGAVEGDEVK